ncbi:hypothetical protein CS006_02715 [Bifidobacterium primatium]|uniref:alpha-L-rhamnosidase n=1 Tax=Bifidobacterium primatium TaxID=2045438 RepID=A0A2M9HB86_9BIFI|nr:family 78 glycoside hydrolase catalytic domain [Bifidobacterium primatium]PJM74074.1 hypothetical protein CS006_02715 [Bifidobacterium primatium]
MEEPRAVGTTAIFSRSDAQNVVYQGSWVSSAKQTSVTVPGLATVLADNELYYWQVEVSYQNGASETSAPTPFVTAVGSGFASTNLTWTQKASVANLTRAKIAKEQGVEKAILSITATDTEAARRHVYNAYVNGTEIGVGPTRRAGNVVYYNSFDITSRLTAANNIIGLYSYSQAKNSGILMQLTYFYANGQKKVVYNSARDAARTQITPMDGVIYGSSNQSIGTSYYRELAQNLDITKFDFAWNTVNDFNTKPWSTPRKLSLTSGYKLAPSIVDNTIRRLKKPSSVTKNSDGSYTVAFDKEIIGDIRLTASTSAKRGIRITEGEQLAGGKAKYRMNTGNVYDEIWQFQGSNITFTGYSLRGFRYVTIYNYPGTLTASKISGVETLLPYDTSVSSFSSNDTMLNKVYALSKYSHTATTLDTVSDSITRERRPYEGDNLVYQSLSYGVSEDYLPVRNTWNWCLKNPSQYTEYRLMSIIGIYQDYLHTGDANYAATQYNTLKTMLATVRYSSSIGLVSRAGSTVDLVDWPRTELPNYNLNKVQYKTVINAVAAEAYKNMAELAKVTGHTADAANYANIGKTITNTLISKCYSKRTNTFYDGLASNGQIVTHHVVQNDYFALAYGIYSNQSMADAVAETIEKEGRQSSGSIYSAYFLYEGLVRSGHTDLAIRLLARTDSSDKRTYAAVLNKLGATIAPEAWDEASKSNMTYSHVWGAGGGAALIDGVAGAVPTSAGFDAYTVRVNNATLTSTNESVPTPRGSVTTSAKRSGRTMTVNVSAPYGGKTVLHVDGVTKLAQVQLDGRTVETPTIGNDGLKITVDGGAHAVTVVNPVAVNSTLADGSTVAPVYVGEKSSWVGRNTGLKSVALALDSSNLGGDVQTSVFSRSGSWSKYVAAGSAAATKDKSAITGVRFRLTGAAEKRYSIRYRVLDSTRGWTGWTKDGERSGVDASGAVLRAIQVTIVAKDTALPSDGRTVFITVADAANTGGKTLKGATYYFANSLKGGKADSVIVYGKPSDVTLVGDWDGDGKDTLAVRRGNTYYVKDSISGGKADKTIAYGRANDMVLVGDWDGDGKDTFAVRRGNVYYFKNSISGGQADRVIGYGKASDTVLVGDWDGDGKDTLAVRRGNTYYVKDSISGGEADTVVAYGRANDTVLVGDWDGDSSDTFAVRRGNTYFFKNTITSGVADVTIAYGRANDRVLIGDWNADGSDTLAVRR